LEKLSNVVEFLQFQETLFFRHRGADNVKQDRVWGEHSSFSFRLQRCWGSTACVGWMELESPEEGSVPPLSGGLSSVALKALVGAD